MSLKKTALAVVSAALIAGATIGQAQTVRSHSRSVYTIPGTTLRVNRTPRHIYHFGGTTIYQFNRRRTPIMQGFAWPYGYPQGYVFPYGTSTWYPPGYPYNTYGSGW